MLSSYKIYVLKRDKDDIDEIIQSNQLLKEHKKAFHTLLREVNSNLSSTYVRNKIKEGKSIEYLTPHEVVKQDNVRETNFRKRSTKCYYMD